MKRLLLYLTILLFLAGCTTDAPPTTAVQTPNAAAPTPTLAQAAPTTAVQPTIETPLATIPPTASAVLSEGNTPDAGQETILIQEPGPGWRLTSPIHVSGIADPTFEQNLVVELLSEDGGQLALVPVTIAADVGQRGPFAVDIPFTISGEQQAFLQVYATSARDGGVTHLSSVGLTIADSGPENRPSFTPMNERIAITQPALNAVVSSGTVHIEGITLASFEATLVVDIFDESGTLIASEPILVRSPDLGLPGPFEADIAYASGVTGAGRIVVRDVSPAFGGNVHLASVEIRFE